MKSPISPTSKPVVTGVVSILVIIAICCGGPTLALKILNVNSRTTPSKSEAEVAARSFVRKKLKDPSSADFGWDAPSVVDESGNAFTVAGKVRSKNSFNAMVENFYSCKLKYDNGDWSGTVIIIEP